MKTLSIIVVLLVLSITTNAQFKATIIKFDFSTYTGSPVKTGWLFSDSTYRRLYTSYTAADTMASYFEKQGARLEKISNEFESLKNEYKTKADADAKIIMSQQETIGTLKQSFDSSTKDTAKLLKQFWTIGSVKLHKGTTVSVGISVGILGYLIGRAI